MLRNISKEKMITRLANTSHSRSIRLRMAFACASAIGLFTPANYLHGNACLRHGDLEGQNYVHACACCNLMERGKVKIAVPEPPNHAP